MPNKTERSLESFGGLVAEAFTEAAPGFCAPAPKAVVEPGRLESAPADKPCLWFSMDVEGALQGRVLLAVRQAELGTLGLRQEEGSAEEERRMLLKLLEAAAQKLQGRAAGSFGELQVTLKPSETPKYLKLPTLAMIARHEEKAGVKLFLCFESQMVAALSPASPELFPEAGSPTPPPAENLGLVLDVELNATLRFGQRQLSLREIMELTSGSVVELDRQVDEPVELVLDSRVIARGEAVIIDGNYGLRITEILHPVHKILPALSEAGPEQGQGLYR